MMLIMFEAATDDIGKIMTAMAPIMPFVSNFSMESREEAAVRPRTKRRSAKRGSKVETAMLAALKDGLKSKSELAAAIAAVGCSPTSVSPSLTKLTREKRIKPTSDNLWALA